MKTREIRLVCALGASIGVFQTLGDTWKVDNPSGLSWNEPSNWSLGVVPGVEDVAAFAWENNKPNGPYYVLLGASHVVRQLEQPAWRNLPDPFYIGTEHDRAAGHTLTLSRINRGGNTYCSDSFQIAQSVFCSAQEQKIMEELS